MVGQIYSMASHTIIYLGASTSESDEVIDGLLASEQILSEKDEPRLLEISTELAELGKRVLLGRGWFLRQWILQELVLSVSPWVQCGRKRVRWKTFCSAILTKGTPPDGDPARVLLDMDDMRSKYWLRTDQERKYSLLTVGSSGGAQRFWSHKP